MDPRTAEDLLPLVAKLSTEEQVRLARLALREAARGQQDAARYESAPVAASEFTTDADPLAWEAEGWDEFSAPR